MKLRYKLGVLTPGPLPACPELHPSQAQPPWAPGTHSTTAQVLSAEPTGRLREAKAGPVSGPTELLLPLSLPRQAHSRFTRVSEL